MEYNLERFMEAQERNYATAFSEMKKGRKQSHWMWYIFPQLKGLGFSSTSQFYGIKDLGEAKAFLMHPVLGARLISICNELLQLHTTNATQVMGSPDDLKLRSSMTLFAVLPDTDPVFQQVLEKFFKGIKDTKTLQLISDRLSGQSAK